MSKKEQNRNMEIERAREKRRKRRKKIVFLEKCIIVLIIVGGLTAGGIISYNMQPEVQLEKQLEEAKERMKATNYDGAISACDEALKIDSTSAEAYRTMAEAYLSREDYVKAENMLYSGWKATGDESLLQYHSTVLLNEAVAEINAQNCTYATLEKCMTVLEMDAGNMDVYTVLDAWYERMLVQDAGAEGFFCETKEGCGYREYYSMIERLLDFYAKNPSEALKAEIQKYIIPEYQELLLEQEHLQEYAALLARAEQVVSDAEFDSYYACIQKAIEVQDFFAEAFTIFESGEFEPIKEFIQNEEYIDIRDSFMDQTMEYWDGKTYIPVTREKVKLMLIDGQWKFAFPDYEEYPQANGQIMVWSAKQEDDGVQRLCISYEPLLENGEYYPHTTYEFIYLYSNVRIRGVDVPQMNYRFETRIATPEGTTTQVIGDWGGEHEFDMEF